MKSLKYFIKKFFKYYIIGISILIFFVLFISYTDLLYNYINDKIQVDRIMKFQNEYLYKNYSSNKLYQDGGLIATWSKKPDECINAMIQWMHTQSKKEKINNFMTTSEIFYEECK